MNRKSFAVMAALAMGLLLAGCGGQAAPTVSPDEPPLSLLKDLYEDGYALAGYHEMDLEGDGHAEGLAVLTQSPPPETSFLSVTFIVLFQHSDGVWRQVDRLETDGDRATTTLHDLTGDGLPELVVFAEQKQSQYGDFVTPMRTAGYLAVFTYTPDKRLVELGAYSSSLLGMGRVYPKLGAWEGQEAIVVARDLPADESPLWQPYQVGSYVWDGSQFANAQIEERRRLSPVVSWAVTRNGPWALGFLALGGVLGWGAVVVSRRTRVQVKQVLAGAVAVLIILGVGLIWVQGRLCVLAPVLSGLAGLIVGWRITRGGDR
jgi:hypothetical protein